MTDYAFQADLYRRGPGGQVILARNATARVVQTGGGLPAPDLKQGGQPVTELTADASGHVEWTSSTWDVTLIETSTGYQRQVISTTALATAIATGLPIVGDQDNAVATQITSGSATQSALNGYLGGDAGKAAMDTVMGGDVAGLVPEVTALAGRPVTRNPIGYQRRLIHELPFKHEAWDAAETAWGAQYPQGATVDATADQLFLIYNTSTHHVIVVRRWSTGEFLRCFAVASGYVSEGAGVTYEAGERYLWLRTLTDGIGKYKITTLPAAMTVLAATTTTTTGTGRNIAPTADGWIAAHNLARNVLIRMKPDLAVSGVVYIPRGMVGGDTADTEWSSNTPKVQGIAEAFGGIAMGLGGQYKAGAAVIPYKYQGVRLYTANGTPTLDALMRPDAFMSILSGRLKRAPALIENEGVFTADDKVYSLYVTQDASGGAAALESGIVIFEEMSTSPDAIDCRSAAANAAAPNEIALAGTQSVPLKGSLYVPQTGKKLTTIMDVCQYLFDSGQSVFSWWNSGVGITDVNGATFPSSHTIRVTRNDSTNCFVEVLGRDDVYRVGISGGSWYQSRPDIFDGSLEPLKLGTAAYAPSWTASGMFVQLDGAVGMSGLAAGVFHVVATLPAPYRPLKFQYYPTGTTVTASNAKVYLRVQTNGDIEIQTTEALGANVVLTGVRFRYR